MAIVRDGGGNEYDDAVGAKLPDYFRVRAKMYDAPAELTDADIRVFEGFSLAEAKEARQARAKALAPPVPPAPAPVRVTPVEDAVTKTLRQIMAFTDRGDDLHDAIRKVAETTTAVSPLVFTSTLYEAVLVLSKRVKALEGGGAHPVGKYLDKDGSHQIVTKDALAVERDEIIGELRGQVFELQTRLKTVEDRPIGASGITWCGIHRNGERYATGALVTRSGALWVCKESTTSTPGKSSDWQCCVKQGTAGSAVLGSDLER